MVALVDRLRTAYAARLGRRRFKWFTMVERLARTWSVAPAASRSKIHDTDGWVVNPVKVASLAFGKIFLAHAAEDPASIERSLSVSQTRHTHDTQRSIAGANAAREAT